MDDLGEELCNYCDLDEQHRGVHNYGGEPFMCVDSGYCEQAYENYLKEGEEHEN